MTTIEANLNTAEIMGGKEGRERWQSILDTEGEAAFFEKWDALQAQIAALPEQLKKAERKSIRQMNALEKSDCNCGGCADCLGQD